MDLSAASEAPFLTDSLLAREKDVLAVMRERHQQCEDAESAVLDRMEDDLRFRAGQQWDPADEQKRKAAQRPCLTINTTPQYEGQITNEMRRNMPSIRVLPVGSGADVKTAKVLQGIIRHLELQSHAEDAYTTAGDAAARMGRGYFRLTMEYEDPMSFVQEPRIRRIRNAFMVRLDPSHQDFCGRDARYGFVFVHVPREQHKYEYGVDETTLAQWATEEDSWVLASEIRLAEYYMKDPIPMTLAKFDEGPNMYLDPLLLGMSELVDDKPAFEAGVRRLLRPEPGIPLLPWFRREVQQAEDWLRPFGVDVMAEYLPQLQQLAAHVVQMRYSYSDRVWHIKTNGHQFLEVSRWPGKHIPIIPIIGTEIDMKGQVDYAGYIRNAKDPMRMKNYWKTMQAEHIALAPPAPWLLLPEQVEGYETEWAQANRVPYSYLPYKSVVLINGQPAPPPIRNNYEPPIQAITIAEQGSDADTQATIGIYRASLGAPSKEQSGVAIQERDAQADTGTYHYGDNLRRALQYCGEQLVELIQAPGVMPPEKVQRIVGDDNATKMVRLAPGAPPGQPVPPEGLPPDIEGIYDVWTGTYDVHVTTGPGYETKRQEATDALRETAKISPKVADLGAHLLVQNIDLEGMPELSQLLKKTLPPELQGDEEGSQRPEELVPRLQAENTGLTQQLQALDAFAKEQAGELEKLQADEAGKLLDMRKLDLEAQKLRWEEEQGRLTYQLEREKLQLEHAKLQVERQAMRDERRTGREEESA